MTAPYFKHLVCGHSTFNSKVGEEAFCEDCNSYQKIYKSHPANWECATCGRRDPNYPPLRTS